MNTNTTRRIARFAALPVISAGIIAGALGFAGAAHAGTYSHDMTPQPGFVATPTVRAPSVMSGPHGGDIDFLMKAEPGYHP